MQARMARQESGLGEGETVALDRTERSTAGHLAKLGPCSEAGSAGGALAARTADKWVEAALGEHASVAAFAKFVLHLLALGAPPSFVERALHAAADEVEHAKQCFQVAQRLSGVARSPGRLDIGPAMAGSFEPAAILVAAIREGCFGETIAAECAAEARRRTVDASIRKVLDRIVQDEARHAELSWDFVEWMLRVHPELEATARACFDALLAERIPSIDAPPDESDQEALGCLSVASRLNTVRRVVHELIRPRYAELFGA